MATHTRTSTGSTLQKLKFRDKLVSKGQSSDALLKKMKALHQELSGMDQDAVDTASLGTVSKDLIHQSVMLHRDKGVKAYAACCMCDLLRLYAPDAPYTALELKDMFQFFFRQLATNLKGPDAPWFTEYVYILESMATIKTVCLVPDLPHGDELTLEIFKDFFDLVKNGLPSKIEVFMSDILVALIEETPGLPAGVLDVLLSQFSSKNARMESPTFRLAVDTCKATSDKLQGPVAQYFSDIIIQHSPNNEDDEEDAQSIQSAHNLILTIHRSVPALLNAVVPQLGEELAVDHDSLRILATQTLGAMFAHEPATGTKYPNAWKAWITRARDRSPAVRVVFVQALKGLVGRRHAGSTEVEQALGQKMLDGDDRVRAAVCKVYAGLDYESALHHVSLEQLQALADRMLDRKSSVRQEAFAAIGKLYRLAYSEIESKEAAAISHFGWIPSRIISAAATSQDQDVRSAAEQALSKYVLPLPPKGDDEAAWTEQLLVVTRELDTTRLSQLIGLSNIGLPRPTLAERFVECCIAYNGGVIDNDEQKVTAAYNAIIIQISRRFFHDHVKAADDLQAFGKLNESRLYKLMQACLDPHVDLKTLVKSTADFSKRLEQASSGIVQTLMDLIRRQSLHIINSSSVPTLVKRIQRKEGKDASAGAAQTILVAVAKQCPAVFKPHVAEFSRALAEESNVALVEVSLQALSAVARWDKACAPTDKRVLDRVERFARSDNARYAKFATRLLAYTKHKNELCTALAKDTVDELDPEDDNLLEARLRVFAELARSAPEAFEEVSDQVIVFAVRDLLAAVPEPEQVIEEDWIENNEPSLGARLKILALKICVNRCLSHATLPSAEDVVKPTVRLMLAILDNQGTTKPELEDHTEIKSHLRLRASISLLKLSSIRKYSPLITPSFPAIAYTVQDSCFPVRLEFLAKLLALLQRRSLDPRYNAVLFVTAIDPEDEIRQKALAYVKWVMTRSPPEIRLANMEKILPRLLHLIAVHPDFNIQDIDGLEDISRYLNMYMDSVLTADNIHLITFLCQKVKSVRVADSQTLSENLYAVSELAQHKIRQRAVKHGWATNAYPGSITLPSDIFKALPSAEIATKIQRTVYLSEARIQELDEASKPAPKARKPRKPRSPSGNKVRRPRKRKASSSDEEQEDSSDGELSDDPVENDNEPSSVRAPSSQASEADDIEMDDEEGERPRRNAPRNARPRSAKKKRVS